MNFKRDKPSSPPLSPVAIDSQLRLRFPPDPCCMIVEATNSFFDKDANSLAILNHSSWAFNEWAWNGTNSLYDL